MAFTKLAIVVIFMLYFTQSISSPDKVRAKRSSVLKRIFPASQWALMQGSLCRSIMNDGCCMTGDCCRDGCCCDKLCHEPRYNDCCADILDIRCFPNNAPGTCSAAGHTGGCCITKADDDCFVSAGNCYCNASCHLNNNCCPDIDDIGCSAPRTCSAAGHTEGCCISKDDDDCFVSAGNCYCNASCHLNYNCCPDISDIGCSVPTNCTAAGFKGGCCEETYGSCSIEVMGVIICSCRQECYSDRMGDRSNSNSCCEDIKDIHCYPRNCVEAGMGNCSRTLTNDCSLRLSQNSSLCYCDATCNIYGRCCPQDENDLASIRARMDRLRMHLWRIQMVIAELQKVGNLENTYKVKVPEDEKMHHGHDVSEKRYKSQFNQKYDDRSRLQIADNSWNQLYQERRLKMLLYLRLMRLLFNRQEK